MTLYLKTIHPAFIQHSGSMCFKASVLMNCNQSVRVIYEEQMTDNGCFYLPFPVLLMMNAELSVT